MAVSPASAEPVRHLAAGALISSFEVSSMDHGVLRLPDASRITHLQFRRFAGCPVCNLHLRTFSTRQADIEAAGIEEVVFFPSTTEELRPFSPLPFALVADPQRVFYRRFGVESSPLSLLHPRAWPAVARGTWDFLRHPSRSRPPLGRGAGSGSFGLPGDFLIAPGGRLLACHYGDHADDQWSVDDLLNLAATSTPPRLPDHPTLPASRRHTPPREFGSLR